jgi:dTDP-4-amino-4,6-dideoxygalactose transaminase
LLPWLPRIDETNWYSNFGPLVRELEATLASQWPATVPATGTAEGPLHVVTLSSGTASLETALAARDLAPGSEVLVPALTFPATAAAVVRNALSPVFGDVDAGSWQLTPAIARAAARERNLALVMPVAAFGHPVDAVAWDEFVVETGIPVLVDAAAAFGNQAIGEHADFAFSLHATKPFGIGEGGLFVTRNAAAANRVRLRSNFGFFNGQTLVAGSNGKLSEYAAAVALAQWARWPQMQSRRRCQWEFYRQQLAVSTSVELQASADPTAIPAALVVRLPSPADAIAKRLATSKIETRRWYCPPLTRHPAFAHCPAAGIQDCGLTATEALASRTLGLPWHNRLNEEQMTSIAAALARAVDAADAAA